MSFSHDFGDQACYVSHSELLEMLHRHGPSKRFKQIRPHGWCSQQAAAAASDRRGPRPSAGMLWTEMFRRASGARGRC